MVHTSTKSQINGVNTYGTFLFILMLLFYAVVSSLLILNHGWNNPTCNQSKLVLHIVIIVTSAVPLELPMELSLADLVKRCSLYYTKLFWIPLAGMVDICCFDNMGNSGVNRCRSLK